MNVLLLAAALQVHPLDIKAATGRIEVQVAPNPSVGIAFSRALTGPTFSLIPRTNAVSLRVWDHTGTPARRFWTLAYEVENTIPYEGSGDVASRVHIVGGGSTVIFDMIPCDLVTFEFHLATAHMFAYHDQRGHVPTYQVRSREVIYLGKCFGPVMARVGISQQKGVSVALVSR